MPLSVLYLARMQNQHRWRADANWDQWKHHDLGHDRLLWITVSHTCMCHLPGDLMCSQTQRALGWRARFKDGTRYKKISSADHTITRQQSIFCSKKRALPGSNFLLSQALHEQSSPSFSPHLRGRASAPPSFLHPFFLAGVSHQLEAFLIGQSLKHSNKLHWPAPHPQHPAPTQ